MADLDVLSSDGKGWTCIKADATESTLKSYARKISKGEPNNCYRIIDNGVCVLAGKLMTDSPMLRWGVGNKKARIDCHLGTEEKPKKCRCGSKPQPIEVNEHRQYIIKCGDESCKALSMSVHSAEVISKWNSL